MESEIVAEVFDMLGTKLLEVPAVLSPSSPARRATVRLSFTLLRSHVHDLRSHACERPVFHIRLFVHPSSPFFEALDGHVHLLKAQNVSPRLDWTTNTLTMDVEFPL